MGYIQVHKITPVFMGRLADDIYIYVCSTLYLRMSDTVIKQGTFVDLIR